jgi:hypothetical protein
MDKVEGLKKKERMKTQKMDQRCQRGRSIRLTINGQQAGQARNQVCKGERIQIIVVFFFSIF